MATPPKKPRARPAATPFELLLHTLGARAPEDVERQALKAVLRGDALPAQQRRAMVYILAELCGVAKNPFTTDTHATAFRTGAQGVAQAVAMITDMTVLSLPAATQGDPTPPAA